jgi:hypothetical protein
MAITAIVQFEVHCYQDGRWTLQQRYPGDERKQAMLEANHLEDITKRPCKVVKETYYPHENRSDSVTVYVSPKAKEMIAKLKKPASGYEGVQGAARAARGLDARSNVGIRSTARSIAPAAADIFWRAVIAMGLSLGSAAIVTAMLSWMLTRLATFGIAMDPNSQSAILTITYLVVFLLGVFALFRFGAPIKRLIAMLWATTAPQQPSTSATAQAMHSAGMTLRPKRKRVPFESEQEVTDMKKARGDLDTLPPPKPEEELPPPPAPVLVITEQPSKQQKREREQDQKQPQQQPQPQAGTVPLPASLDDQPKQKTAQPQQAPEPAFSQNISELHRALAMRFATEVMLPQIARNTDDPVARRGAALFLTGAMAHLAAVSGLGTVGEMGLTMATLPATLPRHAVDAFVSQFNTHVSAPANTMLMNQGRQAMARFLAGQRNDGTLAESLTAWRVPPPSALVPKTPTTADQAPTDYYLMTELRHDDPAVMEAHNHVVREALEAADGREVKHTGRGILARFQRADEAVQSALNITNKLRENPVINDNNAFFALALNAGYGANDDPSLTGNATSNAQNMLEGASRGAIIAQPVVYQNAHASQAGLQADPFTGSWLKLSAQSAGPGAAVSNSSAGVSTIG